MPPQSATAEAFRNDYETLVAGFRGVPLPLPGSPYARARAAQRRLLRKIEGFVRRRGSRAQTPVPSGSAFEELCVRPLLRRLLDKKEGFVRMRSPCAWGPRVAS